MSLRKTKIRGRKKGRSRKRRSSRRVMGEEGKDYEEEEEEDGEKDEDRQQQPKQRGKGGAGEKRTGDQRIEKGRLLLLLLQVPLSPSVLLQLS